MLKMIKMHKWLKLFRFENLENLAPSHKTKYVLQELWHSRPKFSPEIEGQNNIYQLLIDPFVASTTL